MINKFLEKLKGISVKSATDRVKSTYNNVKELDLKTHKNRFLEKIRGVSVKNARDTVKSTYTNIKEREIKAATRNWGTNLGNKTLKRLGDIPQAIRVMPTSHKIGLGVVATMLAHKAIRSTYQSFNLSSQNTPPPAYQGSYGAIAGMRHTNPRRTFNSDFGSGLTLNRVARRKLMPQNHTQWK
jgi:hypothetical protein